MKKSLKRTFRCVLFCCVLLTHATLRAENFPTTVLNLTDDTIPVSMGIHMEYFVDSIGDQSLNAVIASGVFSRSDRSIPNYNSGTKPIWYRCAIVNNSDNEDFFINVANPSLDRISFYFPADSGRWEETTSGNNLPFNNRKYKEANYLFDLHVDKQDTIVIYFKLLSSDISRFPVFIGKREAVFDQIKQKDTILGLYIGLMLVMLLYNLFIYFTVRDNSYLYYASYIITVLLTQVGVFGVPFQYLWPNSPWMEEHSLLVFPVLSGVTGMAFMQHFLHSKEYIPKFNKVSYVLYFVYAIAIVMAFSNMGSESFKLTQVNALMVSVFMLVSAILILRKGSRPAGFFLIAWTIFLCGIVLFVLSDTGAIPYSDFTVYIMPVGSALEVVLLSFALADKINTYRKQTAAAQLEALNQAKENEKIITEQNVILEGKVAERTQELSESNQELSKTLTDLKETQSQLVESEKMASLGQLTAGIAHEINNPINFVTSNVSPLKRDVDILLDLIKQIEGIAKTGDQAAEKESKIASLKTEFDFDYLQEEIAFLLKGINEGSTRTAEIVKGLRIFSRVDEDDLKKADINEGLDSTIIIINNLLNGRITIQKEYGNVPLVECYPGKLNQVFLNLMSNAIYAINAKFQSESGGVIRITTTFNENSVKIVIADNGVGMTEATQKKLFEPFFTTKPVGEGTGLGLSISYNTIKKHDGSITVESKLNEGTAFTIEIPLIHTID